MPTRFEMALITARMLAPEFPFTARDYDDYDRLFHRGDEPDPTPVAPVLPWRSRKPGRSEEAFRRTA